MKWESELMAKLEACGCSYTESPTDFFVIYFDEYIIYYLPICKGKEWRLCHADNIYERLLKGNEDQMTAELKQRGVLE